jgi:hypothetical protein
MTAGTMTSASMRSSGSGCRGELGVAGRARYAKSDVKFKSFRRYNVDLEQEQARRREDKAGGPLDARSIHEIVIVGYRIIDPTCRS